MGMNKIVYGKHTVSDSALHTPVSRMFKLEECDLFIEIPFTKWPQEHQLTAHNSTGKCKNPDVPNNILFKLIHQIK
jgi:disulfide bond formation protein DsbB